MSKQKIELIEYSAKSFVLRGEDTRPYKEEIKAMGAKWNSSLTDPETGEKFGAWLFFSRDGKREEVERWLRNNSPPKAVPAAASTSSAPAPDRAMMAEIRKLHAKIDALTALVESLVAGDDSNVFESAGEESEDEAPPVRLLGKGKAKK